MRKMSLTNGGHTLVDDDVYDVLHVHSWRYRKGYVESTIDGKNVRLHRVIMKPPDDMQIDHKNHDTLDNRRENLRICTQSQNNMNKRKPTGRSSKYRGVYHDKRKYKDTVYEYWSTQLKVDGKVVFKKTFKTEEEAARAYDENAKKFYGEFAILNFPDN